ncbi:MAG: AraC family transcriptional regulator, partial [Alphaproteobacteria bacterium]
MANILDDMLRLVRLRACVYFVRDLAAPWGFDLPDLEVAPMHLILGGTASVRVAGGNLVLLGPGDAAFFPVGDAHRIGRAGNADQSSTTRLLCGHFEWDTGAGMPLAANLPDVMVVRDLFGGGDGAMLRQVVAMIEAGAPRTAADEPGGSILADRLGEVLFIGLLRRWAFQAAPRKGVLA